MDDLRIRFAKCYDLEPIMKFIDSYWKKGHILAGNRKMFEWQYGLDEERISFVIGEENGAIKGVLGFIPYERAMGGDYALALWKTIPSGRPFMGAELLMFLKKEGNARHIVCPGINLRTTERLYRLAGMHVGKMTQWYRLNHQAQAFVIGKICDREIPPLNCGACNYRQYSRFDQLREAFCFDKVGGVPEKTEKYFEWRYFRHPAYEYIVLGIYGKAQALGAVAVVRIQEYRKAKAIRFVDYIGDFSLFLAATAALDSIMERVGAEYVDLYEAGVGEHILRSSGWKKVDGSGNIIPNYFAPFEQSNVDIYYSASSGHTVLFRGDGDQDRPN